MDAALETQFDQLREALDVLKKTMEEKLESARQEASERSDRRKSIAPLAESNVRRFRIVCVDKPVWEAAGGVWIVRWMEKDGSTERPHADSYKREIVARNKYEEVIKRMEADATV